MRSPEQQPAEKVNPALSRAVRPSERSKQRALELRKRQSPPEGILWSKLRARRLAGLKFRRQCPLGEYIADFYCKEASLVVEVDGKRHWDERRESDRRRDAWMAERGHQNTADLGIEHLEGCGFGCQPDPECGRRAARCPRTGA